MGYINLYESQNFSQDVNETICNLARNNKDIISLYKIGLSVQGTPILAINLGFGDKKILINATHHARELMGTILLLDQIEYILNLYKNNLRVKGIYVRELLNQVKFVFVPLVNPDGADLVLNGISSVSNEYINSYYLRRNTFESWKSNIRGVDLNRNYLTKYPSHDTVKIPGAKGYGGYCYFSEPETCALKNLTEFALFDGAISYHSSGEEIYWQYNQLNIERDLHIAEKISKETTYSLVEEEEPVRGSGYKDWFIENYQKPSLTMEIAPYVGERKVPAKYYKKIFEQNKNVPFIFAREVYLSL
ncbi:M14 family zinc carboxypeptidase [Terrisporobacter sp.]